MGWAAKHRCSGGSGLHIEVAADPVAVRHALLAVLRGLEPCKLTDDQRDTLQLILAEVLNNIVEHAYAVAGGQISVHIWAEADALRCEVSDWGLEMPGGVLPRGLSADVDVPVDELPEGGFGWFLIRGLTRELKYQREDGTNRIRFMIDLQDGARPF